MSCLTTKIETLEKELVPIVKNLEKAYQIYGITKEDFNIVLKNELKDNYEIYSNEEIKNKLQKLKKELTIRLNELASEKIEKNPFKWDLKN